MISFKDYLLVNEAANPDINVHLEHVEDELFNMGKPGADRALNFLYGIGQMLSGHAKAPVSISIKWDGAPAIFCGIDPSSKKFFVATKGLFAKEPKLCFTAQDVDNYFGSKPGLANKLKLALEYVPELGITDVVQGDFIFSNDTLKKQTINNVNYITFTPNTITYAVPQESELANKILSAKIGIIFHTLYTGNSIQTLKASFGMSKNFKDSVNVFYDDAIIKDYSGVVTFTAQENATYIQKLEDAKKKSQQIHSNTWSLLSQPGMGVLFKTFINTQVRQGSIVGNVDQFVQNFMVWFENRMNGEIAKLKTQDPSSAPVKNRIEKTQQFKDLINKNAPQIKVFLTLYADIYDLKIVALAKMQNIMKGTGTQTFLQTPEGFEVTAPEGLVAVDHLGTAVKLVDRLTFSKANFAGTKTFDK